MDEFTYEISAEKAGERIDKFLSGELSELSRSYIQKLLKEGMVTLNGRPLKANYRLREKDEIEIRIPPAMEPDIASGKYSIWIFFMRTEMFLSSTSRRAWSFIPAAGHYSGTLVNALLYHCGDRSFRHQWCSAARDRPSDRPGYHQVPFWYARTTLPTVQSRNS